MRRLSLILVLTATVSGCAVSTGTSPQQSQPRPQAPSSGASYGVSEATFVTVRNRVEPVAEEVCRRAGTVRNCDFKIVLDTSANAPANAYQTLDANGRPLLIVTKALLGELQNADEVAFVLGHEASHHIEGHIPKTQDTALAGAVLAGMIVAAGGGNVQAIESAQQIGAQVGSRTFSKNYELEADSLGTLIAYGAGYDPTVGVLYFARSPDPGDQFLGSHPPNADRIKVVQKTAATLG
ncbi:M48 family metalloprotease [Pseudoruegeria sp. SK021]|uniref:M48 family metalloprotease n=1 Tax=Pseudoruegeria sp. SK021 TaxID=1933035 RepID=UPI000A26304A|nr:M48 family metalloprotease [Pseudoruegeria sp. SK021]OSP55701.1 peptidase M48 [Pseudoruegeria sp. SK021]